MVAERGMPLAALLSCSPKRHPLKERDIITDLSRLADHDPHAMIDEESDPDAGRGMNFDPRQPTGGLRNGARHEGDTGGFQPMSEAVGHQGMKPGIRENDLERAGRRR